MIQLVLVSYSSAQIFEMKQVRSILDSLMAYTSRHFEHANEFLKSSYSIQYTLECMSR